jgi:hypothetical protein
MEPLGTHTYPPRHQGIPHHVGIGLPLASAESAVAKQKKMLILKE